MIRNQQGAAQSTLQTGPAPVPMGTGSLKLFDHRHFRPGRLRGLG